MFNFKKQINILDSRDKDAVDAAAAKLRAAGLSVKTWASEPIPVGGCGARIRPSDWSGKKPAGDVRKGLVYHLAVPAEMAEQAKNILEEK